MGLDGDDERDLIGGPAPDFAGLLPAELAGELERGDVVLSAGDEVDGEEPLDQRRVRFVERTLLVEPVPPTQAQTSEVERAWALAKDNTNIAAIESFVARFRDTYYADLARLRIEELKKHQVAVATPPPGVKPVAPPPVRPAVHETPEPARPPGRVFRDCLDCPEMVVVQAGSFTMGSRTDEPQRESWQKGTESPQLKGDDFADARCRQVRDHVRRMGRLRGGRWLCNGYRPGGEGWGRGKRPVINVNWNDAKAYASWLSHKTGKSYRLLSEAEREYVTRAGTTMPFWWGPSISPTQANYNGSADYHGGGSKGEYRQKTVPVDSFAANPWGLCQVHGNVYDWTEDCWNDSHAGTLAMARKDHGRLQSSCTSRRPLGQLSQGPARGVPRQGHYGQPVQRHRLSVGQNVGLRIDFEVTPACQWQRFWKNARISNPGVTHFGCRTAHGYWMKRARKGA